MYNIDVVQASLEEYEETLINSDNLSDDDFIDKFVSDFQRKINK